MKTVLFIHGINKKTKGPVYEGIRKFYENNKIGNVISFDFPDLYEDAEGTLSLVEKYTDKYKADIITGTSLGGFYALCCRRPVEKIVLNPCMLPSKEIPLLTDKNTNKNFLINEKVMTAWEEMEKYNLKAEYKNASAIFGLQDTLFKYIPGHNYKEMFEKIFSSKTYFVNGIHSLKEEEISEGLNRIYRIK